MLVEDGPLAERAFAVDASVGFFVSMDAQMLGEMGLLTKSLSAFGTAVGSTVRVDSLMLQKRRLLFEIFTTCETLEKPQFTTCNVKRFK